MCGDTRRLHHVFAFAPESGEYIVRYTGERTSAWRIANWTNNRRKWDLSHQKRLDNNASKKEKSKKTNSWHRGKSSAMKEVRLFGNVKHKSFFPWYNKRNIRIKKNSKENRVESMEKCGEVGEQNDWRKIDKIGTQR